MLQANIFKREDFAKKGTKLSKRKICEVKKLTSARVHVKARQFKRSNHDQCNRLHEDMQ